MDKITVVFKNITLEEVYKTWSIGEEYKLKKEDEKYIIPHNFKIPQNTKFSIASIYESEFEDNVVFLDLLLLT